jgi:membrane-anchored protein YejM (alkaline phosphatase superfamily)
MWLFFTMHLHVILGPVVGAYISKLFYKEISSQQHVSNWQLSYLIPAKKYCKQDGFTTRSRGKMETVVSLLSFSAREEDKLFGILLQHCHRKD